ncbi:DUF3152 domain-containing protein [Nakamurella antarctica]|uniref:DUF3152 domain-containing protein n=1 Tax=Nakamurella antarctica TaxID=1902245 RepID=UPI0019D21A6F|nr:DUF3152 domain-containing protein [Nakamurella antarctica]
MLIAATVLVIVEIAASVAVSPPTEKVAQPAAQTIAASTVVQTVGVSGSDTVVVSVMPPVTVTAPPTESALQQAPDPNGAYATGLTAGALPPGGEFSAAGDGTFRIVPGTSAVIGTSPNVKTYTIEIENGVVVPAGDADFATMVEKTLADPRSWPAVPAAKSSLQRIDSGEPDFRVSLTSQMTVRQLCGFDIQLEASCFTRSISRVVINDARWVRGATAYNGDLGSYRQYAINHEVGHALNFGHQPCGTNGGLAPVMMQQSWSVSDDDLAPFGGAVQADGKVCKANPWPDPLGGEGQSTATG